MATLHLNNGEYEIVKDEYDFKALLENKLGNDAAHYMSSLIDDTDKGECDCNSYEASLESNTRAFTDILDCLRRLDEYIKTVKRIDRGTIIEDIEHCIDEIHNQI